MKLARLVAGIGFLLFVASFFLVAVREAGATQSDAGIPGYLCAFTTLVSPWGSDGLRMLYQGPVEYFAVLLSGWISLVFLITFVLLLIHPNNRLGGILRIVLIVMFAACWVVFYHEHLQPREGYFLWTAAMLLTVFAGKLFAKPRPSRAPV